MGVRTLAAATCLLPVIFTTPVAARPLHCVVPPGSQKVEGGEASIGRFEGDIELQSLASPKPKDWILTGAFTYFRGPHAHVTWLGRFVVIDTRLDDKPFWELVVDRRASHVWVRAFGYPNGRLHAFQWEGQCGVTMPETMPPPPALTTTHDLVFAPPPLSPP